MHTIRRALRFAYWVWLLIKWGWSVRKLPVQWTIYYDDFTFSIWVIGFRQKR